MDWSLLELLEIVTGGNNQEGSQAVPDGRA
jgi:hypothetical protein